MTFAGLDLSSDEDLMNDDSDHNYSNNYTSKEDQIYGIFSNNYGKRRNRQTQKKVQKTSKEALLIPLQFNFTKGEILTVNEPKEEKKQILIENENKINMNSHEILQEFHEMQRKINRKSSFPTKFGSNSTKKRKHIPPKFNSDSIFIEPKLDYNFASWTKHEKKDSMAAKYMKKFGFKGRLGKNEDGIANPVRIYKRKTNTGLGFSNNTLNEEANQPKNSEQELLAMKQKTAKYQKLLKMEEGLMMDYDEEYQMTDYFDNKSNQRSKHIKYELPSVTRKTYDEMNVNDNILCPELLHNLNIIVDGCSTIMELVITDQKRIDQRIKECQKYIQLRSNSEVKRDSKVHKLKELKILIQKMENISAIKCEENHEFTLDSYFHASHELCNILNNIQTRFYSEFLQMRLWRMYPSTIFPIIEKDLQSIEKETEVILQLKVNAIQYIFNDWRILLSNNDKNNSTNSYFDLLLSQIVIPFIRRLFYEYENLFIDENINNHIICHSLFKIVLYPNINNNIFLTLIRNLIIPKMRCNLESILVSCNFNLKFNVQNNEMIKYLNNVQIWISMLMSTHISSLDSILMEIADIFKKEIIPKIKIYFNQELKNFYSMINEILSLCKENNNESENKYQRMSNGMIELWKNFYLPMKNNELLSLIMNILQSANQKKFGELQKYAERYLQTILVMIRYALFIIHDYHEKHSNSLNNGIHSKDDVYSLHKLPAMTDILLHMRSQKIRHKNKQR